MPSMHRIAPWYLKLVTFPNFCHQKVTVMEDRLIMQQCQRHRFKPAQQIRDNLQGMIGRKSRQTMNNHLQAANLLSKVAKEKAGTD